MSRAANASRVARRRRAVPAAFLARAVRRMVACTLAIAGASLHFHATAAAPALTPLDDGELAAVNGRDGLAFNLSGFSISPLNSSVTTLTYGMPGSTAANPFTLTLSNFTLSRTDDPSPFTDPYTLDLVQRTGLSDVIQLRFPQNIGLTQLWNFTGDFNVTANGLSNDLGNLELKNLGLQGGGLDIAPPSTPGIQGVSFGLSLKLAIESVNIRPRGLGDSTEMLTLSGIRLADATTGGAWAMTDITRQPGLFNAITDADGSALHLQIGWPTGSDPAPTAAISIDRIVFTTNGVTQDFGSSRIAGLQINYMDVRFRPGP